VGNAEGCGNYDESIRLNPKNPEAFYNRGVAFGQTGQYDRALADLNEAVRLKPNDPDYFTNRGSAHYWTGERNKAIADYHEAIRLNPKHTIALTLRARIMATENNEPARASDTSSQTQSTSVPHTTQASDKPNMETPSPGNREPIVFIVGKECGGISQSFTSLP
jgi:regulator of sirC expression with transglutaminase-like and TPR domain